jgi:hypothetical protein
MFDKVIIIALTAISSAAVTLVIQNISIKSTLEKLIKEALDNHSKQLHQQVIFSPTEIKSSIYAVVQEHLASCSALEELKILQTTVISMKVALAFLVKQNGGNPEEFNLLK